MSNPSLVADVETDEPTQRSVLELWSIVLGNAAAIGAEPIPINVAHKVVASWPFLSFQETQRYHEIYHHIFEGVSDLLHDVIDGDAQAFEWVGEQDAEHNHQHYLDALVQWHVRLDDYEAEWRATDPESHIWVAAIADARATLFSQTGYAGHLDSIQFQLGDDEFLEAVRAFREERGE